MTGVEGDAASGMREGKGSSSNHLRMSLLRHFLSLLDFFLFSFYASASETPSQDPPNSSSYQLPISSLLNPVVPFFSGTGICLLFIYCLSAPNSPCLHPALRCWDWDSGNCISQTSLPAALLLILPGGSSRGEGREGGKEKWLHPCARLVLSVLPRTGAVSHQRQLPQASAPASVSTSRTCPSGPS